LAAVTNRPIDHTTIGRLEKLESVPTNRGQRWNAFLLSILYSVDPAELGLGPGDGPDDDAAEDLRRASVSTIWYSQRPSVAELAVAV
jgi:hypothetical protein